MRLSWFHHCFSQIDNSNAETMNDHLSVHLQQLGERLYPKVSLVDEMILQIFTNISPIDTLIESNACTEDNWNAPGDTDAPASVSFVFG